MTPSNNNNGNPLILRILDSLGIAHQVAPVQHSHDWDEVTKNGKTLTQEILQLEGQLTNHSHNEIHRGDGASVNCYHDEDDGDEYGVEISAWDKIKFSIGSAVASITSSNIANLIRAISNPDSTPTESSDNLVTSGGVKAALDNLRNFVHRLYFENPTDHAKAVVNVATDENGEESAIYLYLKTAGGGEYKLSITKDNFANLVRALANPSSNIPESTSSKLITSGAVYRAVSNKLYWEQIHGVTFTGIGGGGGMVLMDSVPSSFHAGDVIRFKKSDIDGCYTGIVTGTHYGIKCIYVSPNIYVDDSIITEGTVSLLRP